jgi:ribokinase
VIAVVGSINLDVVVAVARLPGPGETVVGGDRRELPGGKGANQAVAAARLGADVAFVGRVGADAAGRRLRADLEDEGVDVTGLRSDDGAPSGMALIGVDEGGENAIIVSPGANGRVGDEDVAAAGELLASAGVVLLQHEIPAAAVAAAAAAAGGRLVLNPAPARELAGRADVLVPNRGELERLAGGGPPAEAAARLGLPAVVVTLGAEGALVVEGSGTEEVGAPEVQVVDTTGAGDAFCGALADALDRGAELVEAVRFAVAAAALSVTGEGARGGLPSRAEVEAALPR